MKQITSLKNELIVELTKLKDKKYRNKVHKFLVEGYHLVEEANDYLELVLSTDANELSKYNCQTYLVTDEIIKKLSSTINPQNIIGVSHQLSHQENLDSLFKNETVKLLALEDINDPGNLGTMIRTAAGLGYDGIILLSKMVDLYNEKTIRATQGAIYKIPIMETTIEVIRKKLADKQIMCFGTSLQNATSLNKIIKPNSFMLCFGNEAHGMTKPLLSMMDQNIILPMHRGVESLNVSIASSIIMYEFVRNEE